MFLRTPAAILVSFLLLGHGLQLLLLSQVEVGGQDHGLEHVVLILQPVQEFFLVKCSLQMKECLVGAKHPCEQLLATGPEVLSPLCRACKDR